MTGYGRHSVASDMFDVEVAVRTVNSRFRDIRTHIPKEYSLFDTEIRKTIEKFVNRATVDVYISRKTKESKNKSLIKLNETVVDAYVKEIEKLKKKFKLKDNVSVSALVKLPDVFQIKTEELQVDKEKKVLLNCLEAACLQNLEVRQKEGKVILKELNSFFQQILKLSEKVESFREQANAELEEKLNQKIKSRLQNLNFETDIDHQRMSQELAYFLEKADINEEISRLKSHIDACVKLVNSKIVEGKKIDFYCQELLRETNTIGSKSSHYQIISLVVEIKTIIEKVKEQVQNIE